MIAKTEIFPIEEAFPHGEWNKTIAKFPDQATVFHTREWMKTLEDSLGYRPMCILAMCEDEGGFQAALPFMVYEKFGTKNWLSMPFDTYGGVIGNQKYAPHLMSHFFRAPGFGVRRCIDFNREPLADGTGRFLRRSWISLSRQICSGNECTRITARRYDMHGRNLS